MDIGKILEKKGLEGEDSENKRMEDYIDSRPPAQKIPEYIKDVYIFLGRHNAKYKQRTLLYLFEHGEGHSSDICSELGETKSSIFRFLCNLEDEEILEHEYKMKQGTAMKYFKISGELDEEFRDLLRSELEYRVLEQKI